MRRTFVVCGLVGNSKAVWLSPFRVSGSPAFSNVNKAKRDEFTDGWSDCVSVHAVLHEIIVGDRQASIVHSAMMSKFNFKAIKDAASRQAQDPERG